MIWSSKNIRENYARKSFWTQEKETWVKFNPGLSTYQASNNWALEIRTVTHNREEKLLPNIAMVAKFLNDNKPKTSLEKLICTVSNFINLIHFHLICQMSMKFSRIESKRIIAKFRKRKKKICVVFTYSINQACEIRKCRVAVMQQQLSNVQKSVMFFFLVWCHSLSFFNYYIQSHCYKLQKVHNYVITNWKRRERREFILQHIIV